jgi:hypothetical protein
MRNTARILEHVDARASYPRGYQRPHAWQESANLLLDVIYTQRAMHIPDVNNPQKKFRVID